MAESIPSRRPVSFLDLPGEIKNIIYDLVFEEGSNLRLDHKARDRLRSKNPPVPLDLSTTPEKNALLGTCHSIRTEAMPVLAKHTTLEIRNAFSRADPLSILPVVFLSNISAITVDMDTFVHITRSLMPSLKNVTILKQVEGLGGLHDMLHLLHCPACGGAHVFLREGICDVLDWSWLKNQVIHLSEEEGWTVVFRMQYECASPVESCLEVAYDLKHDKVLSKKGYYRGRELDATQWDEARDQIKKINEEFLQQQEIKQEPQEDEMKVEPRD